MADRMGAAVKISRADDAPTLPRAIAAMHGDGERSRRLLAIGLGIIAGGGDDLPMG